MFGKSLNKRKIVRILLSMILFMLATAFMIFAKICQNNPEFFSSYALAKVAMVASWIAVILCDAFIFFLILPLSEKE